MPNEKHPQQYWAANADTKEFIDSFHEKIREYYTYLSDTGRLERWQRNYRHFFGQGTATTASSNRLTSAGDSGEFTTIKINDYRSILNHAVVLTLQGRPALQCRAANTEVASKQQTQLGNSLIEYHLRQEHFEKDLKQATVFSMLYDEAFTLTTWNANAGEISRIAPGEPITHPETGESLVDGEGNPLMSADRPIRTGKLEHHVFGPYDVVRDVRLKSPKSPWYGLRMQFNRWDLIANYPAFAEQLIGVNSYDEYVPSTYQFITPLVTASDSDFIDGWLFFHEKTPAVPNGRFAIVIDDFAITDVGLPYKKMPIGRIAPAEQDQTSFGYSDGNDLVAIQELRDAICSIIASNEVTFGGQNIAVKKGWGGSRTQLGSFANLFELENPQTDIVPLTLTRTSPELFNFNQYLDGKQGQLLGINPTVRGNPQENIKSGSAMALQDSKAMQYLSGLQESYNQLLESEGTTIIEVLQEYADEPQIAAIAGKGNRSYLRQFKYTKDDINQIVRVQVESVNPLSQTFSGRLQIAQDLLQNQKIDRPEQYLQVLETGRLEPLYGDDLADLFMIDAENEALQEGTPVAALATDKHKDHIKAHRSLLNDPATRMTDANLRQRVLDHIMDHLNQLTQAAQQNPLLLWAIGEEMPPLPPPGMAPGGPPPPNPPGQPNAPKPPGGALHPQSGPAKLPNVVGQHPNVPNVKMPQQPVNPSTGERAPVPPGQGNPSAA